MPLDTNAIKTDIERILGQYENLTKHAHADFSDVEDSSEFATVIASIAAAIDRHALPGSRYQKSMEQLLKAWGPSDRHAITPLAGILYSLRDDIAAGRLRTMTELLHADIFGDFLDMAQHLLDEGYKDAAAVMVGGVLEEHLRKLCSKFGVLTTVGTKPKKADTMNAELAAVSAGLKTEQKSVTAWLGFRNDAAHGKYAGYRPEQIALMIQGVRDFIIRNPA